MDLSKSYEYFQPEKVTERIHIIGCGSVGSTLAENLVRCGLTRFTLWDFDTVEAHNLANQMFRQKDIGKLKVEALLDILCEINEEVKDETKLQPEGWNGQKLSGYVFLCVDNIDLRREIVERYMDNPYIKAMFDVRTMLTGAQHYAAAWDDYEQKKDFLASMQFSHDEAKDETPVSACGVTLGIVTTVRLICALAVNNFIKYVKDDEVWKFCQIEGICGILDCFF